ncbi:DUF4157 domain-containing protein [bacterium]|nr:DUF4157 domain-containing protein [bacterium]
MGKENNNAFYNALRGTGMALTEKEREQFEPRFGTDFKNVRLHNSLRAYKLADQIHARAFTYKNNIVFNRGEYNTTSYAGQKLLAHELTHVIQQTNAANIMPEKISSVAGNQQVIQREFDRTRLQTYLNETYNSSVIESRREYAITQLLDHKNDVLSACRQHGVDKPSFPAAVIWQELYFRGADLTSGAQDVWSVFGPLGGGNWSLGLAQVRPSTAAQVIGDIPFRPRSEMATTQEEYEELPWNLRAAYRALLAYDVNYNVYIAVGYLKLLKERRYGTSSWTSLSEPQLELIASEYSHGPYPMRHTTPNHNGRQAMTIWWGGWFGTSCVQAEF